MALMGLLGIIIVIVVLAAVLAGFLISTYNMLVQSRNKVQDQWAQVDVLLKRRFDLIPNLVETVKGYAKHEESTLKAVVEARSSALSAKTPQDEINANNQLTGALSRLFALSEAYPDLKANAGFQNLQANLKETEDKISYARQFYNDTVYLYKNKLEMFPSNIVAGMFGFEPAAFFEAGEAERNNVKVEF